MFIQSKLLDVVRRPKVLVIPPQWAHVSGSHVIGTNNRDVFEATCCRRHYSEGNSSKELEDNYGGFDMHDVSREMSNCTVFERLTVLSINESMLGFVLLDIEHVCVVDIEDAFGLLLA